MLEFTFRECTLYVPTAFTPNDDGKNDIFYAINYCRVTPFDMKIFNRWGELLFETQNPDEGWDGMAGTTPVPDGVYTVVIRYGFKGTRRTSNYRGNLMLLR